MQNDRLSHRCGDFRMFVPLLLRVVSNSAVDADELNATWHFDRRLQLVWSAKILKQRICLPLAAGEQLNNTCRRGCHALASLLDKHCN